MIRSLPNALFPVAALILFSCGGAGAGDAQLDDLTGRQGANAQLDCQSNSGSDCLALAEQLFRQYQSTPSTSSATQIVALLSDACYAGSGSACVRLVEWGPETISTHTVVFLRNGARVARQAEIPGLDIRRDHQPEDHTALLELACEAIRSDCHSAALLLARGELGERRIEASINLLARGCDKQEGESCYELAQFQFGYWRPFYTEGSIESGLHLLVRGCEAGSFNACAQIPVLSETFGVDTSDRTVSWARNRTCALTPRDLRCEDILNAARLLPPPSTATISPSQPR